MGAKYTEAQKKASMKYLTDKTDDIRIRMPKGTKEAWQQMAQASGRSLTQFIKDCVEAVGPELLPMPVAKDGILIKEELPQLEE